MRNLQRKLMRLQGTTLTELSLAIVIAMVVAIVGWVTVEMGHREILTASAHADLFGSAPAGVRLVNPISSDLDVMRPSILPNLIAACGRNADRGSDNAALFEVGPQFAGDRPEDQTTVAAGVRSGRSAPRSWTQAPREVDAFDAKADALATLAASGVATENLQVAAEAPSWYHPGRSGCLRLGPQAVLAWFGEIHPRVLEVMDVKGPVCGFEVFLDRLPEPKARKGVARAHLTLSPLQAVERDFAFIVDDHVQAETVVRAAKTADQKLITEVHVFDVFAGKSLEKGKKSLAINVVLQPFEKTLTDAEIEAVARKVVASVEKATGGGLRT